MTQVTWSPAVTRTDDSSGGRRLKAPAAGLLAGFALLLAGLALMSVTVPPRHRPRTPEEITKILAEGPHQGDCEACHVEHGKPALAEQPNALIGPNDNVLCDRCHTTPWSGGSYGGTSLYVGSAHGSSQSMVWPGPDPPQRVEAGGVGKCVNCHDPHGWTDNLGRIPRLTIGREEALCLACHDGSPSVSNVRADVQKPFRHPTTDYRDRHAGAGESAPEAFGIAPLNRRHAECEDCHNPHVARGGSAFTPGPPAASKMLLGVSRVSVLNGAAGNAPTFRFIPGSDTLTAPVAEYQLCFKCHSSYTNQPRGQTDLARVLNPGNPSYHPIEAAGKNPGINLLAFAPGWNSGSLIRCGDCHGSDFGAAGPHGSAFPFILKKSYTASSNSRATTADELCFGCHAFGVYADRNAPDAVQGASRFNKPQAGKGHAGHVGEEQVPCYACHITHGSTTLPYLLVTGRSPGMLSYTQTSTGGTCTPTCHGTESYTVNYAR